MIAILAKAGSWLIGGVAGYAVIAAVVLGLWAYVDRTATWKERAKCNAAAIQARLDQVIKERDTAVDARKQEQQDVTELAAEKEKAEKTNAALRKEIADLPKADQCIITPDRSRRM